MGRYLNLLCETNPAAASKGATGDQSDKGDKGDKRGVRSLMSLMSQPEHCVIRNGCPPELRAASDSEPASATLIAPAQWFATDSAADEPPYDKPCPARRGVIRYPQGRFEHFCAVCGAWGAWGFGVAAEKPGRWYCFQHQASGG